jgi:hypothetical protein
MRSENYYATNTDLTFYYERVIDWERLVPLYATPETLNDRRRPPPPGAMCSGWPASTSARRSLLARPRSTAWARPHWRHQDLAAHGRQPVAWPTWA